MFGRIPISPIYLKQKFSEENLKNGREAIFKIIVAENFFQN